MKYKEEFPQLFSHGGSKDGFEHMKESDNVDVYEQSILVENDLVSQLQNQLSEAILARESQLH